ncbi:Uncharacterised protein [Budvicia aquatica]|uniref:Uncharacterized protein n=1 Tax=Budvicia aquatica TaxID=82979 RepID=A0A484ZN43_9GAMM|nr:Uncharacterised protein [Budvicia aquatica]
MRQEVNISFFQQPACLCQLFNYPPLADKDVAVVTY